MMTARRHIIDVDDEELAHLTKRRMAVKHFINLCQMKYPDDEFTAERQNELIDRLEEKLRSTWGVDV